MPEEIVGVHPELGYNPLSEAELQRRFLTNLQKFGFLVTPEEQLFHFSAQMAQLLGLMWEKGEGVYDSGFRGRATGTSLSELGGFILDKPRLGFKSKGWVHLTGLTPGQTDLAGSLFARSIAGKRYVLVKDLTANTLGEADALFEAEAVGTDFNLASAGMAFIETQDYVVSNPAVHENWSELELASLGGVWATIDNDEDPTDYMTVAIEDLLNPSGIRQVGSTLTANPGRFASPFPIRFRAPADAPSGGAYWVWFEIYDDAGGTLLFVSEQIQLTLDALKVADTAFEGLEGDATGFSNVRLAPIVSVDSAGPLEIELAPSAQAAYSNGSWFQGGTQQANVLNGSIHTALDGLFVTGRDVEDDSDFDLRWTEMIASLGAGSQDALKAWLFRIPQVRGAQVWPNPENEPRDGLGPREMRIIMDGGPSQLIARTIWLRGGINAKTVGKRRITVVEIASGKKHFIAYDRTKNKRVIAEITLKVTPLYSVDRDEPEIEKAIIDLIGGPNVFRTQSLGLEDGQLVDREAVGAVVRGIDDGARKFRDIDVKIGFEGEILEEKDLPVAMGERAFTDEESITVKVN